MAKQPKILHVPKKQVRKMIEKRRLKEGDDRKAETKASENMKLLPDKVKSKTRNKDKSKHSYMHREEESVNERATVKYQQRHHQKRRKDRSNKRTMAQGQHMRHDDKHKQSSLSF